MFGFNYTTIAQTQVEEGFRPTLSIGTGMLKYYGDISSNDRSNNPFVSNTGFNLRLSMPIDKAFDVGIFAMRGHVTGNEFTTRYINFRSRVFAGGLNFSYNFDHLLKEDRRVEPFFTAGFGMLDFNSKTDLQDRFGNVYNYWSDGTIRNLPETSENAPVAVRVARDYHYETDIRTLNLDGFGNYSEQSFVMPIGGGVSLLISPRIKMKIGSEMHFTFTNYLDGITEKSIGNRQGDARNDRYLYSYVNFSFDLSSKSLKGEQLNEIEWLAIDKGDYDGDGVIDFEDECPNTPDGIAVDAKGCPLDGDKDGVPDYLDDELDTPAGLIVNMRGVGLTDEIIEQTYLRYIDSTGAFSSGGVIDTSYAIEMMVRTKRIRPGTGGVISESPKVSDSGTKSPGIPTGPAPKGVAPKGIIVPGKGIVPTLPIDPNISYRVQLGAFKSQANMSKFTQYPEVEAYESEDGLIRVYSGNFYNYDEANKRKNEMLNMGVEGAFVKAFRGGQLINLNEARKQSGGAIIPQSPITPTTPKPTTPSETGEVKDEKSKSTETGLTTVGKSSEAPMDLTPEKNEITPFEKIDEQSINPDLIRFSVQIASYNSKPTVDAKNTFNIYGFIDEFESSDGKHRFFIGEFLNFAEAEQFRKDLSNEGLRNAKVVGVYQGKFINPETAKKLSKK
jgi:cell division septation protein DedD